LNIVIRDAKQSILQIDEFGRNMYRNDLPAAVAKQLLPEREAPD
jgi:hypothetical protein